MATKSEIQQAITRLMQAFIVFRPDPEDMKGFIALVYEKLSGFHVSVINRAVEQIIEHEIYFPRIAEMLNYCRDIDGKILQTLRQRLSDYELDWFGNKLHPMEDWTDLAAEFRKYNRFGMAESVLERSEKYTKPAARITPEQAAMLSKKLAGMVEKMNAGGEK